MDERSVFHNLGQQRPGIEAALPLDSQQRIKGAVLTRSSPQLSAFTHQGLNGQGWPHHGPASRKSQARANNPGTILVQHQTTPDRTRCHVSIPKPAIAATAWLAMPEAVFVQAREEPLWRRALTAKSLASVRCLDKSRTRVSCTGKNGLMAWQSRKPPLHDEARKPDLRLHYEASKRRRGIVTSLVTEETPRLLRLLE